MKQPQLGFIGIVFVFALTIQGCSKDTAPEGETFEAVYARLEKEHLGHLPAPRTREELELAAREVDPDKRDPYSAFAQALIKETTAKGLSPKP